MKNYINTMISLVLGFGIGIVTICFFIGLEDKTLNIIKAISIVFVGLSVLLGIYQLSANVRQIRYSNDWNKKQLATIRLHESEKNIKACISALHSTLDIIERNTGNPYEVYEIHNAFGVFDKENKLIFHSEQKDSDIKNLPDDSNQQLNHINEFNDKINGRQTKDYIISLLNEYEYISLNVNNDIFDFETVEKLMAGKITRTFKRFEKYITHLREYHKYGPNVYKEFELLVIKLDQDKSN